MSQEWANILICIYINMFDNTFQIVALLTPYSIPLYIIMSSFFNQNIKGLLYIILLLLNVLVSKLLGTYLAGKIGGQGDSVTTGEAFICKFGPFANYVSSDTIAINSNIIMFTLAYLLIPMFQSNQINYSIVAIFLAIFSIDSFMQLSWKCVTTSSIGLGAVLGFMFGYVLITMCEQNSSLASLMFFTETKESANKCKLTKQKYSCKRVALKVPDSNFD